MAIVVQVGGQVADYMRRRGITSTTSVRKICTGGGTFKKSFEVCHEKTGLKLFVIVISKEGSARAHPSFGMTQTSQVLTLLTS